MTVPIPSILAWADSDAADRLARAEGKEPVMVPVVDADPLKPSALPTPDSYEFFSSWGKKSNWKNTVTIKT